MREILFRGRRLDGGWVCGDLIRTHPCECHIVTADLDDYNNITFSFEDFVDYKTVGQYTGLTDKNGKKIFEGDILRFHGISNYPVFWDADFGAFGSCYYSDFEILSHYNQKKIEVIGNIYDNPELLD